MNCSDSESITQLRERKGIMVSASSKLENHENKRKRSKSGKGR